MLSLLLKVRLTPQSLGLTKIKSSVISPSIILLGQLLFTTSVSRQWKGLVKYEKRKLLKNWPNRGMLVLLWYITQ